MAVFKATNVMGAITLDGSFLQNATHEQLEQLAVMQTELGRVLSGILLSNKRNPKLNIYTMRDDEQSFNITVSYVHD